MDEASPAWFWTQGLEEAILSTASAVGGADGMGGVGQRVVALHLLTKLRISLRVPG